MSGAPYLLLKTSSAESPVYDVRYSSGSDFWCTSAGPVVYRPRHTEHKARERFEGPNQGCADVAVALGVL